MTIEEQYKGNWRNVQDDCMLCKMEKKTEWHLQTRDWVVAEKLGGGPFVVYKDHKKELSDKEWQDMERVVGKVFDDFELEVIMSNFPNHFHAHIVTEEPVDLSDE